MRRLKSQISFAICIFSCCIPLCQAFLCIPKGLRWNSRVAIRSFTTSTSNPGSNEKQLEGQDEKSDKAVSFFYDLECKKQIECEHEFEVSISGKKYCVGIPVDTPAMICSIDNDGNLEPLSRDNELHDELLSVIEPGLEDYGLALEDSAVTLTISGEMDDADFLDEDDSDEDDCDDDEEDVREML